jgi:DNA adenine methylase
MFKAIYPNPNFAIHHKGFDHSMLHKLLMEHRGQYILSYNDCPTIREWYKKDKQLFPEWHYSYQQGETRIGKNRKDAGVNDSKKDSHEILILNTHNNKSIDSVNGFFDFS